MEKRSVEVCVVSARGLKRVSPLWKLKTYAVAWINPAAKYCSKIDKHGDTHPNWNLKFSSVIDVSDDEENAMSLTVEIHSREPLFHFDKLECSANILLKEFMAKQKKATQRTADGSSNDYVELGSFQLRTPSGKPRGMVDVSIRVSQRIHPHQQLKISTDASPVPVNEDDDNEPVTAYPAQLSSKPSGRPEDFPPPSYPYNLHPPVPNYRPPGLRPPGGNLCLYPPRPYNSYGPVPFYNNPPPPPPPPPLLSASYPPESYIGLPASGPAGRMQGLGFGAGALAGGAVGGLIFGDVGPTFVENGLSDAMAQFHGSTLSISTDPLF